MLPLPKPALLAGPVFDSCSSTARTKKDRDRLAAARPRVLDAVDQYEAAAAGPGLHALQHLQHQPGGPPTGSPLKQHPVNKALLNGYTSRMVPQGRAGRAYYDELLASAPDGLCSLCGHGFADTLDHQAPKVFYPLLAVAPSNLAPACGYCNTNKRDKAPPDAEQQTLNPYFDHEAQQYTWVTARISGPPIVVTFHAIPPPDMPAVLAARARYHFAELKHAALYASQAGGVVRVESRTLQSQNLAPQEVRAYLAQRAADWVKENRNGWQAALYTALATDDWYVTKGHLEKPA